MNPHTLYIGREWNIDHNRRARVDNAELRYTVLGDGEPVLCIHGTNIADSLITPLRFYPPLFDDYQMISYYRAGYNGSTLEKSTLSIEEGAQHAVQLLDHLGIKKAHIMAFSFGGVIGFQVLLSYPERAHTAILLEPYLPREEPDAVKANTEAFNRAMELYRAGNKLGAAQSYMEDVCGPSFLGAVEMTNPLDVWERVERAVDTAFTVDFPAISSWGFRMSRADSLVQQKPGMPVLAVMGLDSESAMPGFRETQRFLMTWLPQAERCGILRATHGMQSMNPVAVGEAAHAFLKRHPMSRGEGPSQPHEGSENSDQRPVANQVLPVHDEGERRMAQFKLGDFRLACGITLPSANLAYVTHGTLNAARDNAIVFPNFLGGTSQALEVWIGEGRPLDPRNYFIILPGQIGNGESSSPSNTGPPFDRGAFPPINIADDVIAQHKLLTENFGIREIQLVLGWSVGALQTYEWAVRFPQMVKRVASIAGAPIPSPWTRLWLYAVIEESLTSDPAWSNGFYKAPQDVQAGLRRMAHQMAITLPPVGFYREGHEVWKKIGFSSLDDFIARFWQGFVLPLDPNNLITQARKARAADPSGGGDLAAALRQIQGKMFVFAFTGDRMFPPEECRFDAERIPNARFREIASECGHLATFALTAEDRQSIDGAIAEVLAA